LPLMRTFQYLQVVGIAMLLYDYILTFIDEIEAIWNRKRNFSTIIFFITRYFPVLDTGLLFAQQYSVDPTARVCNALYNAKSYLYLFGIGASDCVLILRTYVIYDNDKRVAFVLTLLLVLACTIGGYFISVFVGSLQFLSPSPFPTAFPGCFVVSASNRLFLAYLFAGVYELGIMIFTWFKVIGKNKHRGSTLMNAVVWDGFVFYSFMFGISAVNIVVLLGAPPELQPSLVTIHRSIHAILSGRLIIRLRLIAARNQFPSRHGLSSASRERSRGADSAPEDIELKPIQRRLYPGSSSRVFSTAELGNSQSAECMEASKLRC